MKEQADAGRRQGFSRGALYLMLQNRIYRGEIVHKGTAYPGQHEAIIDPELWQIVQDKLAANRQERSLAVGAEAPSLLAGLIVDGDGNRMTPTHATKRGKRYRYYVSAPLITGGRTEHHRGRRIPAGDIEGLVLDRLRAFFASPKDIGDTLAPFNLAAPMQRAALTNAAQLSERWVMLPAVDLRGLVRSAIERVTVEEERIVLRLNRERFALLIADALKDQSAGRSKIDPVTLTIEASFRRAGKGVRLVIGDGAADATDPGLIKLVGQAIAMRDQLLSGGDQSIDAMAQRIGVARVHLTSLVRLSYLSPDIVRTILDGRQPRDLSPTRLMSLSKELPHDWSEQRQFLGFATG